MVMDSITAMIVFGIMVLGVWRMGAMPDPGGPNEATWNWDFDFSGGGDFF